MNNLEHLLYKLTSIQKVNVTFSAGVDNRIDVELVKTWDAQKRTKRFCIYPEEINSMDVLIQNRARELE